MRTVVTSVLTMLLALPLPAQKAGETIQVTLIEVPVTVTTSNGEPVRGLTTANFEIYDQGQKRDITHFDVVDFASRAAQPSPGALLVAPVGGGAARRNFMLLFDLANSDASSLVRARAAALNFVEQQVLPGDRVSVGTMTFQSGFQLLATFTTDRKLVRHAIETLGMPKFFHAGDPLMITMADVGMNEGVAMQPSGGGRSGGVGDEVLRDIVQGQQRANDEQQRQAVIRQVNEFASMGRLLDRIAGRKQVILLSEGFDPKALQGKRNALSSQDERAERSALESGEIWNIDTDARYGNTEAKSELQRMIDALRRSDVVLHAMDIKGLRGNIDAREGISSKSNESLYLLTRDTGGQVFRNANNLGDEFARLLKLQEVTYVLGFSGAGNQPGKFHNLKVKLVNTPGGRINYRVGYYEPTTTTTDVDRLLAAGEIIVNSIPVDAVKIGAMPAALPRAKGPAEVPVIVEVEGRSLLEGAKGASVGAEFFVYAFDSQELIRDFAYQRVGLDLSKLRQKLMARGVKFYSTLNLPPGDYTIRVLVRADGSRNGFRSIPLHVPAAGEPSATMAFHDTTEWVMVKAPDRAGARPYPFTIEGKALIPSVLPVIAGSGPFDVALLTYNVPADHLDVAARIEDAAGTAQRAPLSLVGRTNADDAGGVKLLFTFAPPQLARGDYSLVVNLGQKDGSQRQVKLPFRVN
jgi:VWFA-related protein